MVDAQTISEAVEEGAKCLGVSLATETSALKDYRAMAGDLRGVYVVFDPHHIGEVIYVGSGRLRQRMDTHWVKAIGGKRAGVFHPKAWKRLRQEQKCVPEKWQILYIRLTKRTLECALEGILIHRLQPLVNKESFRDRHALS